MFIQSLEAYSAARLYALESLKINEEFDDKTGVGDALNLFAALAVAAGDLEKAGRLFGAAQTIYDSIGCKPEKIDQEFLDRYIKEARETMGDEAFEAVFREGKSIRMKDAIAFVRETD